MKNNEYFCTDSMMGEKAEKEAKNWEIKRDLKVEVVENGIVYPVEHVLEKQYGGVTDNKGNFIELSLLKKTNISEDMKSDEKITWQQYKGANPKYDLDEIEYVDEDVVYIGIYLNQFGHLILETVSRLWFYLKDTNNFNYKAVFIDENEPNTSSTFNELMELFGLAKENLIWVNKKPIRFRSVIVPEQSMILYNNFHMDYKLIIDRIKSNVTKVSPYKKVLFSKARYGNNRVLGNENIDKIFEKNGYKIIYPEELSLYEKISILKSCDMFVSVSGSSVISAMFLKENSKYICLNRSFHLIPPQFMIDIMYNFNAVYVDAYLEILPTGITGPFILGANENLINFFDHYKFEYEKNDLYKNRNQIIFDYFNIWTNVFSVVKLPARIIYIQVLANSLMNGDFFDSKSMPYDYIYNARKKKFNIFAVHINRNHILIYIFGIRIAFKI